MITHTHKDLIKYFCNVRVFLSKANFPRFVLPLGILNLNRANTKARWEGIGKTGWPKYARIRATRKGKVRT